MKNTTAASRISILLIFAIFILPTATNASEKEVLSTLKQWHEGLLAKDVDAVMSMVSEDFEGERGEDKASHRHDLEQLLATDVLDDARIDLESAEIIVDNGKATAFPIRLEHADENRRGLYIRLKLEDEADGWRIVSLEGEPEPKPDPHEINIRGHYHTHLPVDYSLREDADPYPDPDPAGDGQYWWKGNLHTHTLWSDGDQFPEVIVQWYVEHGYHFLALSDHNILSKGKKWINPNTNRHIARGGRMRAVQLYRERFGDTWVDMRRVDETMRKRLLDTPDSQNGDTYRHVPPKDEMEIGDTLVRLKALNEFRHLFERAGQFILLQSEEITERDHWIHVNATNIRELIKPQTGETVEDTIRLNIEAVLEQSRKTGQPMIPHLNHPNAVWAVSAEDMAPVENLHFFEVYNGHRGTRNFGNDKRVDLDRMWDIVLTLRLAEKGLGPVYGIAADDAHHYEHSGSDVARPGRGWVVARSRFLTPEHIIGSLQRGDFYSSTGITLSEIEATDDRLKVTVDTRNDNNDSKYTIQFIGTREDYDSSREYHENRFGQTMKGATMKYSDEIGEVLKEVEADSAEYIFRGDEIYVRARVISSELHPNPFAEGERKKAWIQPVIPGKGLVNVHVE